MTPLFPHLLEATQRALTAILQASVEADQRFEPLRVDDVLPGQIQSEQRDTLCRWLEKKGLVARGFQTVSSGLSHVQAPTLRLTLRGAWELARCDMGDDAFHAAVQETQREMVRALLAPPGKEIPLPQLYAIQSNLTPWCPTLAITVMRPLVRANVVSVQKRPIVRNNPSFSWMEAVALETRQKVWVLALQEPGASFAPANRLTTGREVAKRLDQGDHFQIEILPPKACLTRPLLPPILVL